MQPLPLLGLAALALVGVPLAFGADAYLMSLLIAALTVAAIALPWALLANLGGMLSFGHAAFFGVGAYTSAILAKSLGVPIPVAMLAGGVAATLASVLMLPTLRLRGPYFALAILAYAQIFRILAIEARPITNGSGGILSIPPLPALGTLGNAKLTAYLGIVLILAATLAAYAAIRASRTGLALRAMHGSEDATRVIGVPATRLKTLMLFVSAFTTGVVGAFNAHVIGFLEPDYAFAGTWSVLPIVAAIFGGWRTLGGPVVGALVIYLLDQLVFKAVLPQGHQIMFGVLLIVMILFSPRGLVPLLGRFAARSPRRAHAPA